MFAARFSIVFCFLSLAVTIFAGTFSSRDINELAKKISERRQKITSTDAVYAISASDAWLGVARNEFEYGSNSLADIGWQQTQKILKLIDNNNLPLKTIEPDNSNLRVKEELWLFADQAKKDSKFDSVAEDVARLEVTLSWAGLKTWHSGWKSASSLINDAQKKADEIQKILSSTGKITQPPTSTTIQQPVSSAIITRHSVSLVVPADITLELTGRNGTPAFPGNALIVGDNADKFKISNDAPQMFPLGITTITWKAVDNNGKTLTAVQKINVVDTTPPTIMIPSDINFEMTTPDGMEINPGIAMVIDIGDQNPKLTNNAPKLFPVGTTIVTWTAQDSAGNIATAGQKVIIADTTPPVIKAPEDITVEATDPSGTIINIGPAKATDNLDPMPTITTDAPEKFQVGLTVVHWTATDKYGNKSRVSQKINVIDTTKPELVIPSDIIHDAVSIDNAEINIGLAKVRDNADATPVVTNDAPANFPLGETIVTWTVKDISGNINSAKQKISVQDKKPPVLTGISDITVEAVSPNGTMVDLGTPVATDNIDKNPIIKTDAPSSFKPGSYIITWTVTDKAGNQIKTIQKVNVTDITPPRILPPADIILEASTTSKVKLNIGIPEVADNADLSPKVANDAPLVFPLGTTIVTWLSIDSSGNRSMATQRVKITDSTPPTIIAPRDVTVNESSTKGTSVLLGKPVVHDNLDQTPIVSNNAPQYFKTGITEVIWMVIDDFGNSAIAVQKVNVIKSNQKNIMPQKNNEKPAPSKPVVKSPISQPSVFLPASIHFTPNSAELQQKSITVLKSMLPSLQKYTDIRILIVGCADSSGSLSKNIEIANTRADVVADYLLSNGVIADRMLVDSKIIQTDGSAAAGANARETKFYYSSPTVTIKIVNQTTDLVIIEKKEVKKSVANSKPVIKKQAKIVKKSPVIKTVKKSAPVIRHNKPVIKKKPTQKKKSVKTFA